MAAHINFPLAATARLHYDKVLNKDGEFAGLAHYPGHTANERAMLSLGSISGAYSQSVRASCDQILRVGGARVPCRVSVFRLDILALRRGTLLLRS